MLQPRPPRLGVAPRCGEAPPCAGRLPRAYRRKREAGSIALASGRRRGTRGDLGDFRDGPPLCVSTCTGSMQTTRL